MNKKIASLLMASALSLSLIAPALAFDPPPSGDTTPSIDGSGNITWEITDPNAPSNPGTTTPGGSSGSGGGSYVPPAKPSVTIDKQSSGAGTFNVSVGADKITIVTSPTQGNVVDTITVTDKDGNVLTLTKTSENHYECDRPANGGKVTVAVTFKPDGSNPSGANPFVDVQSGVFFYDAVLWAVQKGVTTGTSATTFGPGEGCTRGQIVTFLYRAS